MSQFSTAQISLLTVFSIITILVLLAKLKHKNLPPGPRGWPLIGNLPLLFSQNLHITLTNLSRTHGPIMTLWFGTQPTVIASTPESAFEVLKTHDRVCSGRHIPTSCRVDYYTKYSIGWSDCGDYWKLLRKISRTEIFSTKMLHAQSCVRGQKIAELMDRLKSKQGQTVKLSKFVFATLLDILGNVVFSKNVSGYDEEGGKETVQDLVHEMLIIGAAPNLGEFYPVLERLDLQGLKRRFADSYVKFAELWEGSVKERRAKRNVEVNDMLDVLLVNGFDDVQINAFFLEIFGPGSETSIATIEWAMAELIKNPREMAKVHRELDDVVGSSTVNESHLTQLPYLQACIKEAMRLHPPAPFFLPHRAVESCEIMGYTIPKDCRILVNSYALGRDPKSWNDPARFRPERFIESDVDYYGAHYEFIPFGSGRRICPGMPLATRIVPLIVGSLLHTFNWSLPGTRPPEELDLKENLSLSLVIDPSLCVVPHLIA